MLEYIMLRILFIGTAEFAVRPLELLVKSEYKLVGVVTQPDKPSGRRQLLTASPVKNWLEENNLHSIPLFQPEKIKNVAGEILEQTRPDLIVVVAYGQILPQELVPSPANPETDAQSRLKFGAINIHGSLLPQYRGAIPIEKALLNGDRTTGVSILQMTPGLDDGPVWMEREVEITDEEDAVSLRARLSSIGAELLLHTVRIIIKGTDKPVSQSELAAKFGRQESYCNAKELDRHNGELHWGMSVMEVARRVKAFANAGGAWISLNWNGKQSELKIWKTKAVHRMGAGGKTDGESAVGILRQGKKLYLPLADGLLEITELQLAGKSRNTAENYLFLATSQKS